MDPELLKWLASLGVGGVLAGMMFFIHRNDAREWRKSVEQQRDAQQREKEALLLVVKENTSSNTAVIKTVEANTKMLEILCRQWWDEYGDNGGRRQRLRIGGQQQ